MPSIASPRVLTVMTPLFSGLAVHNVSSEPLYELSKLALQKRGEAYAYRSVFSMVTLSAQSFPDHQLLGSIAVAALLSKPNGILVVDGECQEAWDEAVSRGIVRPTVSKETRWKVGTFGDVDPETSVSKILADALYRVIGVDPSTSDIKYYLTSLIREEEVRKVYQHDKTYDVTNTTSAFHGIMLKALFPDIRLKLGVSPGSDETYQKVYEFSSFLY